MSRNKRARDNRVFEYFIEFTVLSGGEEVVDTTVVTGIWTSDAFHQLAKAKIRELYPNKPIKHYFFRGHKRIK